MGFFKKLKEKASGFSYVVDIDTFGEYIQKTMDFASAEDLCLAEELYIHHNGEKILLQVFNLESTDSEDEGEGFCFCCEKKDEYKTLDELLYAKLPYLPQYFKITLPYGDSVFLNEYKKAHPELNPEDY